MFAGLEIDNLQTMHVSYVNVQLERSRRARIKKLQTVAKHPHPSVSLQHRLSLFTVRTIHAAHAKSIARTIRAARVIHLHTIRVAQITICVAGAILLF